MAPPQNVISLFRQFMRSTVFSSLLIVLVEGQWGLWQQQQQQPIQPQWTNQGQPNLFQNLLNPLQRLFPTTTTTTAAPTTTTIKLEDIPNPDQEQGQWPVPNPANWPTGPDWNDERNSWDGEFGWGGRDYDQSATVSLIRNGNGLRRFG